MSYPYYNRSGQRIEREKFVSLFESNDYRTIRRETVRRPFWAWVKGLFIGVTFREVFVSTVWLGIDHSFGEIADPVIFETMAFGGGDELYQGRYTTEDEAIAGHETLVRYLKRYGRVVPVK